MFHLREGFFFQRSENGDVTIRVALGDCRMGLDGQIVGPTKAVTVSPSEWASAVASVSAAGETGETHQAALDFHNGHPENARDGRW